MAHLTGLILKAVRKRRDLIYRFNVEKVCKYLYVHNNNRRFPTCNHRGRRNLQFAGLRASPDRTPAYVGCVYGRTGTYTLWRDTPARLYTLSGHA